MQDNGAKSVTKTCSNHIIDSSFECSFQSIISSKFMAGKTVLTFEMKLSLNQMSSLSGCYFCSVLSFLHFREVGARAAGESVLAVVTVSSTTSPSGPLQSPRDGGPLSSSALTQRPPPAPGQAGVNTCPVRPTKHSALSQSRYHVSQTPHRCLTPFFPFSP